LPVNPYQATEFALMKSDFCSKKTSATHAVALFNGSAGPHLLKNQHAHTPWNPLKRKRKTKQQKQRTVGHTTNNVLLFYPHFDPFKMLY